ncbi:MAG: S-methyl-5'-thioadenosine phosphorylase [Bacillota bacterium]
MPPVGIIGGTSVYSLSFNTEERTVDTNYGQAFVYVGQWGDRQVVFLARHGKGHQVPPHRINYRANIMALKQLGVVEVLATASVGSLVEYFKPGDLVLLDQFIDFTQGRPTTFFDGGEKGVVHIDLTEPYCPRLRKIICAQDWQGLLCQLHPTGTYVCTEGPRFETPAEITMFKHFGGHLVGMTNVPEVILAREAELCYMTVAVVTNYAAGISREPLTHREVVDTMAKTQGNLLKVIQGFISQPFSAEVECSCRAALRELGQF